MHDELSYVKTAPTKSDQIFYQNLLPSVRFFVKKNPKIGFSLLYFYELFSVQLYAQLRKKAKSQNLLSLEKLFLEIEKDEFRHIDSMKNFMGRYPSTKIDRVYLYAFLWIFRLDIHMGKFSLHNRSLRKTFLQLGIHPDTVVNKSSKRALSQCMGLLRKSTQ